MIVTTYHILNNYIYTTYYSVGLKKLNGSRYTKYECYSYAGSKIGISLPMNSTKIFKIITDINFR